MMKHDTPRHHWSGTENMDRIKGQHGSLIPEESPARGAGRVAPPLCVDLDGTLVRTDTLLEGLLSAIRDNIRNVIPIALALFRGRAAFKAEVACRSRLAVELLPENDLFLRWLSKERAAGRQLVLCTAANWRVAEAVSPRFGIFSDTLASTDEINLKGELKAQRLCERFGEGGFDYAGNDASDLAVWRMARQAVIVSPSARLLPRLGRVPRLHRTFPKEGSRLGALVRAMRPHQWVKNLLVFLPAIAGHQLLDPNVFLRALTAFVLFSLCASGVYLVNDLLDLEADRKHPKKRDRPLAAGELDLSWASVAAAGLLAGSTVAAVLLLGGLFAVTLLGYVVVTSAYSIKLKGIAMVDALTLAGLYTTRVIAGGVATDIRSSFWLLAFSVFIFLSLAMVKRNAELIQVRRRGHTAAQGRGYFSDDLPLVQMCGVSAGYMSVLVLAMYIHAEAGVRYRHPELIWLLCPVVLYWTGRIWLKAHRGQMDEDPIVFALRDRPSILAGILAALVFLAAI